MSISNSFGIEDLRADPWTSIYLDIPEEADHDLLYLGYAAAQWCRQYLIHNITELAFEEGSVNLIVEHSDIALKRMREINRRLRKMY